MWRRWRAPSILRLLRSSSSSPHLSPPKTLTLILIPPSLPPTTTLFRAPARLFSSSAHQTLDADIPIPPTQTPSTAVEDPAPAPDFPSDPDAAPGDEQELTFVDPNKLDTVVSILRTASEETLESDLSQTDLALAEEFVMGVLESPGVPAGNLIAFFRWAAGRVERVRSAPTVELLVRVVADAEEICKKDAYKLWDLIKDMGEDNGPVSTEILNRLITIFWRLGKGKAALEVFDKFEDFCCVPDADSYYLTIEALGTRSMVDTAWSVCEKMVALGRLPDEKKISEIITFLCKGKKAKEAHSVYQTARENKMSPPMSCLDCLINGLLKSDETVRTALELIGDYSAGAEKYANKTFSAVIKGLCRIKEVQDAKRLLLRMVDLGPPPGSAAFNPVITALSKAGEMEDAVALMKAMESRGLRPDVYTYTVIMSGFAKGGLMEEARVVFDAAKKRHAELSPATYHILTRGYCKLEEFDKALECFEEMKKDGMQPNKDEYTKMIQSLCLKALDWRTAEKLLEEMKDRGFYIQGSIWSLVTAVKELEEEGLQSKEAKVES